MKRTKVITIAFAFMLVLLAASTQNVSASSRSDTLRAYINGRYDVERGGYSPPSDDVVRVDATYGAILALNELGILDNKPPPINITKALDALIDRQWTSNEGDDLDDARYGGFSEYLLGPVTMKMTYMGIILLDILKDSDYPGITDIDIDTEGIIIYVNKTQSDMGGFSSTPDSDPDMMSTFQALFIINMLDLYDSSLDAWSWLRNETATIEWINDCKVGDAYKISPDDDMPSVSASASAVMALNLLPSITTVSGIQATMNWILERQIIQADDSTFSGGFEEGEETGDPNFYSTYYALKALDQFDRISSVNSSAVIDFILSCQVEDGSWGFIPGATSGNLVYAGQSCELLNILGNAANILASSADPNTPTGFIFDWRLFLLVGIIVASAIMAIVALRTD